MRNVDEMAEDIVDTGESVLLDSNPKEETPKADPPKEKIELIGEAPATVPPVATPVREPVKAQAKSYLDAPEPVESEPEPRHDRNVPVSELQKERRKRQVAEQEMERLRAEAQKNAILPSDNDALAGLLENPDDLIDGKTAAKLIQQASQQASQRAIQEIRETLQAERQTEDQAAKIQMRKQQIVNSEEAARRQFVDYDAVVSQAIGLMTPDELLACRKSANPGAVLYRRSKEVLSVLGVQPAAVQPVNQPTPQSPGTPPAEQPISDEDVYAEFFGRSKTSG